MTHTLILVVLKKIIYPVQASGTDFRLKSTILHPHATY